VHVHAQDMMEAEAFVGLKGKRTTKKTSAGASSSGGKRQQSGDYLESFWHKKFKTPDKGGGDESSSSHESPGLNPMLALSETMAKFADGSKQNAQARLYEAETRRQESAARAEHDRKMMEMMSTMFQWQQQNSNKG